MMTVLQWSVGRSAAQRVDALTGGMQVIISAPIAPRLCTPVIQVAARANLYATPASKLQELGNQFCTNTVLNHFLTRTLIAHVSAVSALSSARTFTPLRYFPPTLLLPLQYQGFGQLRPYCWQSTSCAYYHWKPPVAVIPKTWVSLTDF